MREGKLETNQLESIAEGERWPERNFRRWPRCSLGGKEARGAGVGNLGADLVSLK